MNRKRNTPETSPRAAKRLRDRTAPKSNEAEQAFQRTLTIRERSLGADHLDVAETLEDYADLLRQIGRGQEAEKIEERVRKIRAAQ